MLGNAPFSNKTLRKVTVAFLSIFNDLTILRDDSSLVKVPVAYQGKEKWYARATQESSINIGEVHVQKTLPRMGVLMSGLSYDTARQLPRTNNVLAGTTLTNSTIQYVYTPYKVVYDVDIAASTMADLLNILEQIIPFFTPKFNLSIYDNPLFPDKASDIPVTLQDIRIDQDYSGSLEDSRRILTASLRFVLDIGFYGPSQDSSIIKKVIINIRDYSNSETDNTLLKYEVVPDPLDAEPTDNYGFTETITNYEQ